MLSYDVMHFVPPRSAPDWIKTSPLSTGKAGYVSVDKHVAARDLPERVLARRLPARRRTRRPAQRSASRHPSSSRTSTLPRAVFGGEYHGYASCPLVVSSRAYCLASSTTRSR
ncbi:MAG: hypothetical protein R2697_07720 [Ilumatobacteraceae bacterium]